ncbi:MAG: hypothetical protein ACLGHN_10420 [Bacteriovoracia bacterium]
MIEFQILQGPDENVISSYKFFQNQIYLGRTSGDLQINDHNLYQSHVMLEVIGKELLIHPQRGVEFFLINGKRASAIRKLKINDLVTLGQTELKVLSFEETEAVSKKNILNNKLNKLIEESSSKLSVIESLTKLMKQ